MSENEFLNCLTDIGNICTKKEIARMRDLRLQVQMAERSSILIHNSGMAHARVIGMEDKIIRLERNVAALSYLLSMSHDIAESMRSEIVEILKANDMHNQDELQKRKETIKKLSQKKYNDNKK